MYTYEERMKAVQLYIKYDMSMAATIRELGYPSRGMLYLWYKEYEEKGDLRQENELGYSKFTSEQRRDAIDYYLEHGRSVSRTIKALGYPKRTALRDWVKKDLPDEVKHCVTGKTLVRYTQEQREQAVIQLCSGEVTAKELAADLGATESTIRRWRKSLLGEGCSAMGASKKKTSTKNYSDLVAEKESLELQLEQLQKDVYCLQMERDVLLKADEILKKDRGINLKELTNREKAVLIDALRDKYRLKELLVLLELAKSSYCYQRSALHKPDKYAELRTAVKDIFTEAHNCYGFRRVHASIRRDGICISEKVIRKIMRDEQLIVLPIKKRKYSSYVGEISPEVENIVDRDFSADTPNTKWLTDITEFSFPAGKVYLSPIVDCFDGMVVSWTIGTSPDAKLANSMLDAAISILSEDEHPVIHSDRGGHYRWPGWIERMQNAKLTRSMSKKGCSPDNAACEGFFGRLKNEMFYGRSWLGVCIDEFISVLDSYMHWYNEKRIKMSLGAKSPLEYRQSLGLYNTE